METGKETLSIDASGPALIKDQETTAEQGSECKASQPNCAKLLTEHLKVTGRVDSELISLITHIDTLCRTHCIEIDLRSRTRAASVRSSRRTGDSDYKPSRRIRIAVISQLSRYFVALHEIGHIVGRQPRTRIEREYSAWRWALDNAVSQPDENVWLEIHAALRSYIEWAKARQYRQHCRPVIPPRTYPLWALMAHAKANF